MLIGLPRNQKGEANVFPCLLIALRYSDCTLEFDSLSDSKDLGICAVISLSLIIELFSCYSFPSA
jgi:hypothetical protein